MHILYITGYAPTQIRTRPYNLIRHLARSGQTLTLATLWENDFEKSALDALVEETGIKLIAFPINKIHFARNLAQAFVAVDPLQSRYSWQPDLARAIEKEVTTGAQYDIVHVEHLRGSPYALHLKSVIRNSQSVIPIIYDSVDSISLITNDPRDATVAVLGVGSPALNCPAHGVMKPAWYPSSTVSSSPHPLTNKPSRTSTKNIALNVPTFQRSNVPT